MKDKYKKKNKIRYGTRLKGVHPNLIRLLLEVNKTIPLYALADGGCRSLDKQKELYQTGKSKTLLSKHIPLKDTKGNDEFGRAADVAPYYDKKVNWDEIPDFAYMCGFIKATAMNMGIKIRQGCKWDEECIAKNKFRDYGHVELVLEQERKI